MTETVDEFTNRVLPAVGSGELTTQGRAAIQVAFSGFVAQRVEKLQSLIAEAYQVVGILAEAWPQNDPAIIHALDVLGAEGEGTIMPFNPVPRDLAKVQQEIDQARREAMEEAAGIALSFAEASRAKAHALPKYDIEGKVLHLMQMDGAQAAYEAIRAAMEGEG